MMEAVKRGGNRQELHEIIRTNSMAATAQMKEGNKCDLLARLAAEPAFGMTEEEMEADVYKRQPRKISMRRSTSSS